MNRKQLIVLVVVILAIGGIVAGIKVLTSPAAMPNHVTFAEARADVSGRPIKVAGDVVPGTINWDYATQSMRFMIAEGGDQTLVVYRGRVPGDFKPGQPLIVEGRFDSSGVFNATALDSQNSPLCKTCHNG